MIAAGLDVFAYFQHEDEPTAPRYAERLLELVSGSEADDEAERLPGVVDGAALVVDEPGIEPGLLHRVEGEVGRNAGCLLRPGDPEPTRRREPPRERRKGARQLTLTRREEHRDVELAAEPRLHPELLGEPGRRLLQRDARFLLDAELLRQRRGRVILVHAANLASEGRKLPARDVLWA